MPPYQGVTVSRPVGGILSGPRLDERQKAWVAIHLSGLPGEPSLSGGGRAAHFPRLALLRVGFTEPAGSPPPLVRSYRTLSPLPVRTLGPAIGGFLSVALSCGSPRLAVSQHPALRSPDLPQHGAARYGPCCGHLADSPSSSSLPSPGPAPAHLVGGVAPMADGATGLWTPRGGSARRQVRSRRWSYPRLGRGATTTGTGESEAEDGGSARTGSVPTPWTAWPSTCRMR